MHCYANGLYVLGAVLAASICLRVTPAFAGESLPPHAVAVDQYGTWTCERGYLMRAHAGGFECIPEEEAAREPQFEVSDLPSAGDGAPSIGGGEDLGQGYREAPVGAQVPIVIQSNQPWTMVLDEQGNPSAVIVGGSAPHGRPGRSRGDHHRRDRQPRPDHRPARTGAVPQ